MTDLCAIAEHYGTDKGPHFHGYTAFYDALFRKWRSKPINMLEIGVAGGESIKMWCDWFTNTKSTIYGVDVVERKIPFLDSRAQIIIGDASQPNFIFDLTNQTGPFDLIVDDGSHLSSQQKDSMRLLWPHVKPGGYYVVEDTHSSYHQPWTMPGEVSFIESMINSIHFLNEAGHDQCGKPTEGDLEEIIFRKSLVVLKKRVTQSPRN